MEPLLVDHGGESVAEGALVAEQDGLDWVDVAVDMDHAAEGGAQPDVFDLVETVPLLEIILVPRRHGGVAGHARDVGGAEEVVFDRGGDRPGVAGRGRRWCRAGFGGRAVLAGVAEARRARGV